MLFNLKNRGFFGPKATVGQYLFKQVLLLGVKKDILIVCMKKQLHPDNYRLVVFEDLNNGFRLLTRSTATSEETITWEDGKTYPLIKVHVSSASHPFFTGEEKILDIEGRVDKFKARAAAAKEARDKRVNAAKKQAKRQADRSTAKTEKAKAA